MIEGARIAVVVPAFRVEREIEGVLRHVPGSVDDVIVVDDASPDDVGGAVARVSDPRVRLVRHSRNEGVGGAMLTGFQAALAAGADIVVKCDGDGQMDPRDIPALVVPILEGRADYAKGCRFHHVAELRAMPRVRLAGNVVLTFLTKLASGYWHVLDPQNGFVAVPAATLRRLPLERLARGYFFENDMLIRLNVIEARVADVPFPSRYEGGPTSLRPARTALEFPGLLLRGFVRRVFLRYVLNDVSPVAVFALFGAALFAFGALFGGYHWVTNARRGITTPTGTVILSAVPLILGFQLLLQALVLDVQASPRALPEARPVRPGAGPRPDGSVLR